MSFEDFISQVVHGDPCKHGHRGYCGFCSADAAPKCDAHKTPHYCVWCGTPESPKGDARWVAPEGGFVRSERYGSAAEPALSHAKAQRDIAAEMAATLLAERDAARAERDAFEEALTRQTREMDALRVLLAEAEEERDGAIAAREMADQFADHHAARADAAQATIAAMVADLRERAFGRAP